MRKDGVYMKKNNINKGVQKNKKSVIGIVIALVVLVALLVTLGIVFKVNNKTMEKSDKKISSENKENEGKHVKIEVVGKDGKSTRYSIKTKADYLRQALEETEGLTVEGDETATGLFVKSINGVTADYNIDKAYWAFYLNNDYCQKGIDSQEVTDGDEFKIVYTKENE